MGQQRFVRKNTAMIEAARRNEKKRTRRTVFYILLFTVVSVVFLAVCVAVFLKVETINVSGNERYSYEQIIEYVPIELGDNLFSFDADEIEANITEALPYVGTVKIKRDLPTAIEIIIEEEQPYYASQLADDTYVLSSDLKVLECYPSTKASSLNLATLTLNNVRRCIVGREVEFVSERTVVSLNALYDGFEQNMMENKIKGVDVRSRFDIYINYDNRFEVYLGDTDNIDIKLRFLAAIIDELEPGSTGLIDVSNPQEASVALS